MDKKRSVGLIVLGVIYILIGILFLVVLPLFSILYFVAGIGILLLKPFGRNWGLAASFLGIIINTIKLVMSMSKGLSSQMLIALVITYLIHCGIIYYLTRPKIKEQFR